MYRSCAQPANLASAAAEAMFFGNLVAGAGKAVLSILHRRAACSSKVSGSKELRRNRGTDGFRFRIVCRSLSAANAETL
jgi:hypothetical protein